MKINEIKLEHYGKYKDKSLKFGQGLNVVYGQNEAGKSTLFSGLMTLFYGFKPANKDAHPYLGWGDNQLSLQGEFHDKEGLFTVERKLSSNPIGRLYRGDKEFKINNRPIEQVVHLSKQTFESIYALNLKDMVQLSEAPWSEIEDRLILNYGIDAFQSPREVIIEIEEEMRKIYNPRGQAKNTEVKQLELAIRALSEEKRHVEDRQSEVLTIEENLKKVENELVEKQESLVKLADEVNWWESHGPIIKLYKEHQHIESEIERLVSQVGDIPETIDDYQDHAENIKNLVADLEIVTAKKENLDKTIQPLTLDEEACLKQLTQLKTLINISRENRQQVELLNKEENFLQDKKNQLERHLSDILKNPTDDQLQALSDLNLMALEGKFDHITALKNDMEAMQRELFALETSQRPKGRIIGIVSSLMGGLIFVAGTYFNQDAVNYLGVLFVSFGLFKLFFKEEQSLEEDKRVYGQKYIFNQNKIQEKVNEIHSQITFISLDKERIIENGPRIYQALYQAKEMASDLLKLSQTYTRNRQKIDLTSERLHENLKTIFSRDIRIEDVSYLMEVAEKKQIQNKDILMKSGDYFRQIEALENKLKTARQEQVKAEDFLKSCGEGSITTGLERLETLKTLKRRLHFVSSEIESSDPSGLMRKEVSSHSDLADDEKDLSHKKLALSRQKEIIEEMKVLRQKHKSDLEHLLPKTNLFEVESQLLALKEDLEQAKIAYDELQLLKAVVEGFDQSYREDHQPDILKKTGMYFKQFSRGKYPKIYNDEGLGKTTLLIRKDGEDHLAEEALSQGAKDQLYLSLRLALADELDKDLEGLPLFLDEVFVNWDMERLDEAINLLNKLSNERQIILFTCHNWLVEKIKEQTRAQLVLLNN
jgi:uncharacterized protein YhaN